MSFKVAIIGSGQKLPEGETRPRVRTIGKELAIRGAELYTGGCWGFSYESVLGAAEISNSSITAVSPAHHLEEHIQRFHHPVKGFTDFIFVGRQYTPPPALERRNHYLFMHRSGEMIALVDKVVVLDGTIGTIHELVTALHEGIDIGFLKGEDGLGEFWHTVVTRPEVQKRKGRVIYEEDPVLLVQKLLE